MPLPTAGLDAPDALTWASRGDVAGIVDDLITHLATFEHINTPASKHIPPPAIPVTRLNLPGNRRELPERIQQLAVAPIAHQSDASAITWTILLSAAHARWTLNDIEHAAFTERWPGLEHLRTQRTPYGRTARKHARQHLIRQWHRAIKAAHISRPLRPHTTPHHLDALLNNVLTAADNSPDFRGSGAAIVRRCVLDVLCVLIRDTGQASVDLDIRRWADKAGISKSAVARHIHYLRNKQWIVCTAEARGTRSATYTIGVPVDVCVSGTQEFPPPVEAAATRISQLRADIWTVRSLGKPAALTYHLLCTTGASTGPELCNLTGLPEHTITVLLKRMQAIGLVGENPLQARTGHHVLDSAAKSAGVHGVLKQRRERYATESRVWAWWCEEMEWRKAPRDKKPTRVYFKLYGDFPRLPSGAAAFSDAIDQLCTAA